MQHSFGYFSRILAIFDISGFSLSTIHELKPQHFAQIVSSMDNLSAMLMTAYNPETQHALWLKGA